MRWIGGITTGVALSLGAVFAGAQEAPKPAPAAAASKPDAKAVEFFETKIRPLLAQQCFACHNDKNAKGKLRLDTAAGFFKGGETGPLVVPGHPDKGLLLEAVSYTKDHLKMPPQVKLKPQQLADLTAWVQMGAPWPNAVVPATPAPKAGGPLFTPQQKAFWAFQPVRDPALPAVKNAAWAISPIDRFILAKLEAKGLKPAPKADRRTLIRRVTFDLTGLPPTPEEVRAFVSDTSPDAWAKVIDRLLASPAYGERWARHWLDVARYADSNGLDENTAFGNAWRYRDYVVNSFNKDKPYDQFIREQVAGDLLPPSADDTANAERLTATGFLVLGPKVLAEPDKQKMVMDIVDEQVDTLSRAVMGLTVGCARCHDHKFDPIPTKDYYSLAGIFKSTRTMDSLNTVAKAYERPLADKDTIARQKDHQARLQAKRDELKQATDRLNAEASAAVVNNLDRYLLVGLHAAVAPMSDQETPDVQRAGTVLLEAEKFARGDVQVTTTGNGEGIGIIESAGRSNAYTEYDVVLPAAGDYQVAVRYASGQTRPVKISLDGKPLVTAAASQDTGGFGVGEQVWRAETVTSITAGKHVLRIDQAASSLPHIDKIAFIPAAAPVAAPATSGGRSRTRMPAELAQEHGLDADTLRRSAAYVLAAQRRAGDRIFEPWRLLSELPAATFAQDAQKLVAEWKASGKLAAWSPPVAALFSGEAPASLEEAAARYKKLFLQVDQSWNAQLQRSKNQPGRLNDPEQEALRQVLYGARGAFGLDRIQRFYSAQANATLERLKTEAAELEKNAPAPAAMVLAVEEAKEIGDVKVHIRGNHLALGETAPRQFLRIVAGEKQTPVPADRSGRLELANWLTDPKHPLTARVMVNRIWQGHFGEGIVRSPDNFGKLGERPTHPELLDWLALHFAGVSSSKFQVSGSGNLKPETSNLKPWSMKSMHRMILLSNTYQMSTAYDARAALADPENRLLWRANRRRVEVEAIRDSMLSVSGELDRAMGGNLLKTPNFGYVTNDQSGNGAQYDSLRRSLYLPVIRNAVYDVFQVFDFVEPSLLSGKRANTTVAPQALFLMNGQFVVERARAFARQLLDEKAADDGARITSAYLRAFGRSPQADETAAALAYVKAYDEKLAPKESDAEKRRLRAWQSFCQILFASNEFVYVN